MEIQSLSHKTNRSIEILLQKLEDAKIRNPRMSLRGFAQRIGLSPGGLSEILSGKRALSHSTKKKVAERLVLSPQETIEFFNEDLPIKMQLVLDDRLTLSQDQFHLVSDWWYFGILNLLRTRDFKNNLGWIADRLGLTLGTVKEAWNALFRLGYLEEKNGSVL